jgi:hypothetical protein
VDYNTSLRKETCTRDNDVGSKLLGEYDFKITYIKGTMNQVVDALS